MRKLNAAPCLDPYIKWTCIIKKKQQKTTTTHFSSKCFNNIMLYYVMNLFYLIYHKSGMQWKLLTIINNVWINCVNEQIKDTIKYVILAKIKMYDHTLYLLIACKTFNLTDNLNCFSYIFQLILIVKCLNVSLHWSIGA